MTVFSLRRAAAVGERRVRPASAATREKCGGAYLALTRKIRQGIEAKQYATAEIFPELSTNVETRRRIIVD